MVEAFCEICLTDCLPIGNFVGLFLLQVLEMALEAQLPGVDQLKRVVANLLSHFLHVERLVQRFLVESLDEGVVLRCQNLRLVDGASWGGCALLPCQLLLLVQLFDDSSELQDLVVDRIHLVLVLEKVVFVHVLYLEFVVLRTARFNAELIVKDMVGVLAWLKAARTDRRHVVIAENVIRAGQHVGQLELAGIEGISARVIPLRQHRLQLFKMLLLRWQIHHVLN